MWNNEYSTVINLCKCNFNHPNHPKIQQSKPCYGFPKLCFYFRG